MKAILLALLCAVPICRAVPIVNVTLDQQNWAFHLVLSNSDDVLGDYRINGSLFAANTSGISYFGSLSFPGPFLVGENTISFTVADQVYFGPNFQLAQPSGPVNPYVQPPIPTPEAGHTIALLALGLLLLAGAHRFTLRLP